MEQLEQIPIGQQANDGTGDPLRNGMAKVNANFTKVQTGVDAVELTAANAAQTAAEAKTTADAAIPAAQKSMAGGVAPLDATGKVPAAHLPDQADYIPVEEKGAPDGVAPLDAGTKVPVVNLPVGTAGGVAPLDAQGKVPADNLPAAEDSIPLSEKGQPGGVATLDTGGKVPAGQLPPIPTGAPAGSVAWWPLRSSIPAGQIPADGQTISRATFPDLAAMVAAGTVPVVSEADWLADPLKRGCYTLGDGSTTIRVPDYNGKSAGSLGVVFPSGDGLDSPGTAGLIQLDAFQGFRVGLTETTPLGHYGINASSLNPGGLSVAALRADITLAATVISDGVNGTPRVSNKTRPQSVTGVWTIQAFGAITNPGSADAAQLASDLATLQAAFQSEFGFVVMYPGGSAATPGIIPANTQMVVDNPFAGYAVHVEVEHRIDQQWFNPGWYCMLDRSASSSDPYFAWGIRASHNIQTDKIVVSSGKTGTATINQALSGGSFSGAMPTNQTNAYFRLKVWKLKGKP